MAKNITHEPGYKFSCPVTFPLVPVSGDPVRYGALTGIALTDEGGGGNTALNTSVDFGPFIANFMVDDEVGGGIAIGDPIYFDDANANLLCNDAVNGFFFGMALEAVNANDTAIIAVMHMPSPGAGAYAALGIQTAQLANGAVTEGKIDPASLTGLVAKVVANANVIGGIPVLHRINIAGGAAGNTDVVLTHKTRIIDVWAVHTAAGEAGDTIQVFNGAAAITNAMDWKDGDKVVVRAGEIDDAAHEVAAGGTLRVTTTDNDAGGDVGAGIVYVLGIRVA